MSKLKEKYLNANKAFGRLKQILAQEERNDVIRDSIIKRFEFTVELCWKLYKVFFEITSHKINSPKDVFREMLMYKILNEEEVEIALNMIDARNSTAHEYDENKANDLVLEIPLYIPIIEKMLAYKGLRESIDSD
jgi:nucleotidyltransferase substrate binding protein (TIGR01987 family)